MKYTPKDGLVSSRVQKLYQDSRGRMFFLTGNGLTLYDGARFLNYTVEDGLGNPIVNDVLEITEDSILVATNTGSLNAWVKGAIKTIKTKNGFCPVINKFYRDRENIIWVASDQGLFRLDKDIFTPLPVYEKGKLIALFSDIVEIGNYFLLTKSDGSYKSDAVLLVNKKTLSASSFFEGMGTSCVVKSEAEKVLLIIAANQLFCFDLHAAGMGMLKPKQLPERYKLLRSFALVKILFDNNNNIWASSGSAVLRCNDDGQIQSFDKTNGLDVRNIASIHVDKENILWILTDGSGVVKLVNKNVEIITGQISQSPVAISAICPDAEGNVWMFDLKSKSLYRRTNKGFDKWQLHSAASTGGMSIRKKALVLFERNTIFEAKLSRNNTFQVKQIYYSHNDSLNFLRAETDKAGNIYFPGIKMLGMLTNSGELFTHPLPDFADWITFDQHEQIWTITRNGHLYCFEVQPASRVSPLVLKFHYAVNIVEPRSIVVDKQGQIWIGTRYAGLYCLKYHNGTLVSQRHWSKREGLTDNFVYYLACDKDNAIWIGTQSGLDKITPSSNVVESITRTNNIYQMIQKVHIGTGNDIWAIGQGGVIRVKHEHADKSNYQPRLQIMRMETGDNVLSIPSGKTVLPSHTRQVTFEVAAPSFVDEKRITYSYRLDGREQIEWSAPTVQSSFHLVNLRPGHYTLHIRSFFPVAQYNTGEVTHYFTIMPPWWSTWWFRSLIAVGIIMTLVSLTRLYYQRKLQKQKIEFEKQSAVEQERTRIAMEMHDDLGSGLTSIRYLATGLTFNASPVIKEKAVKIETSAKQLVDSMNDIIWTMKSDNNKLSETLNYVRKQAGELLETAGLDYHFDFPKEVDDTKLTNDQKRNLILISKEAVHNVIKHSNATSLTITATRSKENLRISFSDNGTGFSKLQGSVQGNGLINMQRRATQINATIQITHEPGTTVDLTMKLT